MNIKEEALEFANQLQTMYFEERDLASLLSAMEENTTWIGTGEQEVCRSLENAEKAFSQDHDDYDGKFKITKSEYDVMCLTDKICVLYGSITAKPENEEIANIHNRITAVLVKMPEGMKLVHLHMSVPDADQELGKYFVRRDDIKQKEALRFAVEEAKLQLRARNAQLEELAKNTPGGIHECKCDELLTLISISNSFYKLIGFKKEEIVSVFNNSFSKMIYTDDQARVKEEMSAQLSNSNVFEVEFRIISSNGEIIWILEQGKCVTTADGSKCLFCNLMDITKRKQEREELRLSLEKFRIIVSQTNDIVFEWNILKDALEVSNNYYEKFGFEAIKNNISNELPLSNNIHEKDRESFINLIKNSRNGISYSEIEVRIKNKTGAFIWNRIRATVQFGSDGSPINVVGIIIDIDKEKRKTEHLLMKAQLDSLTNLFNKNAVHELVEKSISNNENNANNMLMIIDLDNFKLINDTFGHLCGDFLLSDIAGILKAQSEPGDIIGRIGGDEFILYSKSIKDERLAILKAQNILNEIRKLQFTKDNASITVSIGIAILETQVADYYSLYQSADKALYYVKQNGRNNISVYNPNDATDETLIDILNTSISDIDSEIEKVGDAVGDRIAQYAFRMLYNSIDINVAVKHLLEIVGRAYDVSRVYIFESSKDGKYCSNTFEWCNYGIAPEKENLQNLSYDDDLDSFYSNFDEKGIFYCKDIRELQENLYSILAKQGIYSVLQCKIMDNGVYKGYVGFDECKENRSWTKAQIASLTFVSNILSIFLVKLRLKEELECKNQYILNVNEKNTVHK